MAQAGDTRGKLIDAALEQVETHGYRASTTKRIAAAAGVNEASIFRLFGSKDALVRVAIYERTITAKGLPRADRSFAPTLTDDLASMLREHVRSVLQQMPIYRVFMLRTEYDVKMNAQIFAKAQSITAHLAAHLRYLQRSGLVREVDHDGLAETMASLYLVTAIDLTRSERSEAELAEGVDEFVDRYSAYLSSVLAPGVLTTVR